jgi:hypothetical protein
MAFGGLRRHGFMTHGWLGWWWAKRYAYPRDGHGVEVPLYGWVKVEQAADSAVSRPMVVDGAAVLRVAEATAPTGSTAADGGMSTAGSSNITALPTRA